MVRAPKTTPMPLAPDRVDYLPMIDRPVIKWPHHARVAFCVAPNIEHYEYLPPLDGLRNPWPRTPLPDAQQYSLHEYGNRVGFWRLLEVLDEYRIRCSTTLNIGVLEHFPDIAEAGFLYQTDWKIDDQPLPIKVRSGRLICIPYTSELNDAPLMRHHYEGDYYAKICKRQFDQLYREGEESGRLMCIAFHPYIMGRPHRAKYLAEVLDYIMSHDRVWQATTDEIAEHYLAHYYEQAVAHAARLSEEFAGLTPTNS